MAGTNSDDYWPCAAELRAEKEGTNHHSDLVWGRWSAIGMTNGFKANWPGVILDLA